MGGVVLEENDVTVEFEKIVVVVVLEKNVVDVEFEKIGVVDGDGPGFDGFEVSWKLNGLLSG